MKKLIGILSIVTLMALLAGIVIAQEMTEKTEDKDQVPMMRGRGMMGRGQMQMRGRGGMMGRYYGQQGSNGQFAPGGCHGYWDSDPAGEQPRP